MNPPPNMPDPDEMRAALGAALCDVEGADARLVNWSASPVSKRGTQRTLRYDLDAWIPGESQLRHHQWVGKYYEREDDARNVAGVLGKLAAVDCGFRHRLVIPRVVTYRRPCLLLLTYQAGESVIGAIARHPAMVLETIARALAALHTAPVMPDPTTSPAAVLGDLRRRIEVLCVRFPGATGSLRNLLKQLERQAPRGLCARSFLHGDLGPAQLLWQRGRIVALDFDKCTHGDPALDLGSLLTQLRRLAWRKPDKLPPFAAVRWRILDSYRRWAPVDPGLDERVGWYERAVLLRKIHHLASNTTRHQEAEAIERRQVEVIGLLEELPVLLESG